jgi:hypothetical protein
MSDDVVLHVRRDVVAASCGQAHRIATLHDEVNFAGDDVADLLVGVTVAPRGYAGVEGELYQHQLAAVAQDATLRAVRCDDDGFLGGLGDLFHGNPL